MAESASICASVALAAYAESLVDGGRVIVFGNARSPLAERLVERGARLVHVYDVDPTRVAEAATRNISRNIALAPLGEGGLAIREGSFDVALVEDLTAYAQPAEVLLRVDRTLSGRGVALIAAPNPEASVHLLPAGRAEGSLDYYSLYDIVAQRFEHVRMLGQTPFVGYAVVDFAQADDPQPSFDTAFIPGGAEDAEWFVALASQRELALESFSVIQLPLAETLDTTSTDELREQLGAARDAERQARDRMAQLESGRLEAEKKRRQRASDSDEVLQLRKQLGQHDTWMRELEARATTADARADDAQAQLDTLQQELEQAEKQREELLGQLENERARARSAVEAEQEAKRAKQLDAQVARLESELTRYAGLEQDACTDVERLERQLVERGEEVQSLSSALREATRTGKELLRKLEDAREPISDRESAAADRADGDVAPSERSDSGPTDRQRLQKLAARQTRQEADLAAAEWTITRLLSQIEATSGPDTVELCQQLHEAQAKLQHQSVLLHQQSTTESEIGSAPRNEDGEPDR